jgi:predicted metalloprotease
VRLLRSIICALTISLVLAIVTPYGGAATLWPSPPTPDRHAQAEEDLATAADTVRELSLLEAARDFDALYERMHPDARTAVPQSAVVGWYESFFVSRETSEATVTEAFAEPWTWGVTGETYEDAVTVRFVQPYTVDGVPSEVAGEVHLVPFDSSWGWFFGASRAFVDEQIALYGDDGSATIYSLSQNSDDEQAAARTAPFPDPLHEHINAYWRARFAEAGRAYVPPQDIVAFDEPIVTACGRADPEEEAAFYCVIDEKIYYSAAFRTLIETQIGDFAWVVVAAHEWAHHIQAQLGFDLGVSPDLSSEGAPLALEQQADCLAGSYAIDAEMNGWLDPGDIDEALYMTEISGDPPGTAWNDPRAHGSSEDRIDAFLSGYSGGPAACDLELGLSDAAA